MARNSSLITFLTGCAIGAALVYLTSTENGRKAVSEGRKKLDDIINRLDNDDDENDDDENIGNASAQ